MLAMKNHNIHVYTELLVDYLYLLNNSSVVIQTVLSAACTDSLVYCALDYQLNGIPRYNSTVLQIDIKIVCYVLSNLLLICWLWLHFRHYCEKSTNYFYALTSQ